MIDERRIFHRGQWKEQQLSNSFETFRLYGGGVEADVMRLNDGKTLVVAHPADFRIRDEDIENMSPAEFAQLKVKGGEQTGGAAPTFREYLAGCYDRGISVFFEIKGSTPEVAAQVARRMAETIKEMQEEGAFIVREREHTEFLEQMGIHSVCSEAVIEARHALEESGLRIKLGFTWLGGPEQASKNLLAASSMRYYQQGEPWEQAGLRAAKEISCDYVFFVEPCKITDELVQAAHRLYLELCVYIPPSENSAITREKLLAMKVDRLLY